MKKPLVFFGLIAMVIVGGVVIFYPRPECSQKDVVELKLCAEKIVHRSTDRGDILSAFKTISKIYANNPALGGTCHALTHDIGKTAYKLFVRGHDIEVTPEVVICAYGFYHGFIEELVIQKVDLKVAQEFCARIDRELAEVSPDVGVQCYHGIGHGVVNNHDSRTLGDAQAMIDPAIALCQSVSGTPTQLFNCISGVYNGMAAFYFDGLYSLSLDHRDPFDVCKKQKLEYQEACFSNINMPVLRIAEYDLVKAALFLEEIRDDSIAQASMRNLAAPMAMLVFGPQSTINQAMNSCRVVSVRLHEACILGYMQGLFQYGKPKEEYVLPLHICASGELTTNEQNICYEGFFANLSIWYGKEMIQEICGLVPDARRPACLLLLEETV